MAVRIPKGVRMLTISTAVRWFGWGLGEAFLPVFFLLFMKTFFGVGLVASAYNIVFFLAIPFASFLADNIMPKKMILAGLVIYVFIGLGYFAAGLFAAAAFLFIARALNGVSYSLDQVGRETYIIRHTPNREESRVFGRFDLIANFWWMFALAIGLVLVTYFSVPIHWLLLFIAPTSIISFFIVLKKVKGKKPPRSRKSSFLGVYKKFFNEIKRFSKGLRLLAMMYFAFGIIASIIYFFAPTISYSEGGSLVKSVIIILAFNLPTMLGEFLGRIADKRREATYFSGVLFLALMIVSLMFIKSYVLVLLTVFFASTTFELFYLTNKGVIARITERTHLGEVDGSLNAIGSAGAVIGPVIFGLLVDQLSVTAAYLAVIAMILVLSVFIYRGRHYLRGNMENQG